VRRLGPLLRYEILTCFVLKGRNPCLHPGLPLLLCLFLFLSALALHFLFFTL
jgi:hypothetical protein